MEVSGQLHAPAAFILREVATGTNWIGGWVGLRAGLDAMTKRKYSTITPAGNLTQVVKLVA
jgi:hypothetical protein